MPVDPTKRQEFLDWYAKELEGTMLEDEARKAPRARIPFMSPMLTWATTGGVQIGQMCRWYGVEGSGKSLTNWGIIQCAQQYPEIMSDVYERRIKLLESRKNKLAAVKRKKELKAILKRFPDGMKTIIFDAEGRADLQLAGALGIKTSRDWIEISYEDIIENVCEAMASAMEAFHIVILDSASSCESIEEATLEPGKQERGSAPRAWRRIKRVRRAMDKTENTLILVDQVRTQLGQTDHKGQAKITPPNVRILKHQASTAIEFNQGSKLYLDANGVLTDDYKKASDDYPALGTDGKEAHGLEMRCKVMKNSTGRPFRNSRMRFRFPAVNLDGEVVQDVGFDHEFELLEAAQEFKIIEAGGGGMYYLLNENHRRDGKKKWKGEARARVAIAEDEVLKDRIEQRLVEMT